MKFEDAANKVKTLSQKPDDETLLRLYALYKQSTKGDCDIPKPWPWDVVASAKWNAWYALKGISREDSQRKYIKLVERLMREDIERLRQTISV